MLPRRFARPGGDRHVARGPATRPARPVRRRGGTATAGAVGVSVVAGSSAREVAARSDAPAAAVSWGCGVVTTWVRRCCESRWVRSGMRAPPPMVATALTCAGVDAVVVQRVVERGEEAVQRLVEELFEFGPGQPDAGALARQVDGDRRRRVRREPVLGQPARLAQPGQRTHHGGAGRVGLRGVAEFGRRPCAGSPRRSSRRRSRRAGPCRRCGHRVRPRRPA